jgi:hypothetical protein
MNGIYPKSFIKLLGGFVVISFRFIPPAVLAFGIPSRQFSVLENLARRALQEKPTRLDLEILTEGLYNPIMYLS